MNSEPALILGAVQAALALAVSFGFGLSNEQIGAILAFASALTAVIVRSQVTPIGRPGALASDPSTAVGTGTAGN
jgi:hypothetical protein